MAPAWWWPEGSLAAALELLTPSGGRPGGDLSVAVESRAADRVLVEACTSTGRAVAVEFRVRLDTVEVACQGASCGVFDREALREWLAAPRGFVEVDEVLLMVDRLIDFEGRVAITLVRFGVHGWALSPGDRAALTAKV